MHVTALVYVAMRLLFISHKLNPMHYLYNSFSFLFIIIIISEVLHTMGLS